MAEKKEEDKTDSTPPPTNEKELNKLTKRELKELCSEHGLATSGKRNTLYERLKDYFDFDSTKKEKEIKEEKKIEQEEEAEIETDQQLQITGDILDKEEEAEERTKEEEKIEEEKEQAEEDRILIELNKLNYSRDTKSDLKEVLDGYNKLHKTYPENEYIQINKGICHQYLQNYDSAVECYVDALKQNPDNIEARMLLEGCRVMGIEKAKEVERERGREEGSGREEEILEVGESDQPEIESEAEVEEKIEEAEQEASPEVQMESVEEKEKVHIKGTYAVEGRTKGYISKDLHDLDTKSLTESKSKLSNVLSELKSELQKSDTKDDGGNGGVSGKIEMEEGTSAEPGIKPLDMEQKSLKDILDNKKSDDDFGSRILNSARKLLDMSSTLGEMGGEAGSEPESKQGELSAEIGAEKSGLSEMVSLPQKSVAIGKEEIPDIEDFVKPKKKKPSVPKRVRTGNVSLDKLLQGGFMSASNILVNGPSFVEKDIFLYKFATMGFRMNIPCIIINPETAPDTIKDKFNHLLGDLSEFEEKELLYWLDPESVNIKSRFKLKGSSEFPDMHQIILNGLDHYSSKIYENHDIYYMIFFSMSPIMMFQEPKTINKFLSKLSNKIKEDNAVALYTLDSTVHEQQELGFVKRVMDGVLEIKQEAGHADHVAPKNYMKVDKFPFAKSYEWQEFKYTDKNFELREIPTYKKVM